MTFTSVALLGFARENPNRVYKRLIGSSTLTVNSAAADADDSFSGGLPGGTFSSFPDPVRRPRDRDMLPWNKCQFLRGKRKGPAMSPPFPPSSIPKGGPGGFLEDQDRLPKVPVTLPKTCIHERKVRTCPKGFSCLRKPGVAPGPFRFEDFACMTTPPPAKIPQFPWPPFTYPEDGRRTLSQPLED
jgi:hypothetical protein